jgi:predicted NUDIX family NTP pyrophosphohydrolase
MPKLSAGLLLYRSPPGRGLEVLLVHPGGPIWARRDAGAWSIPKGEYLADEDPVARAEIEFEEELGRPAPDGDRVDLGEVRQAGGKRVRAWAVAGDLDVEAVTSNTFDMEWPRGSGVLRSFPEIDRAAWFGLDEARTKLLTGQRPLLDRLADALRADRAPGTTEEPDR